VATARAVALGFSVHTGWAVLVAVSRSASSIEVVDRRRVEMMPVVAQDKPPYVFHAARELPLEAAGRLVQATEEHARSRALEELRAAVEELHRAGYQVTGSAIIASRHAPPSSLESILRSHASIHAAEGALYRTVIRSASEELGLAVLQVPADELVQRAAQALGLSPAKVPEFLARVGRDVGPPWTADQKAASLAALLALQLSTAPLSAGGTAPPR